MISVEEARDRITAAMPLMPAEQVALADAFGRVLAEDVRARRTQPPSAVSAMDGYAVRAADVAALPARLTVIGEVPAGQSFAGTVGPGQAVRIFTGAPVPDGADAIVIQENTTRDGDAVDVVDGKAPAGRFIRPAGLDFSAGDRLLAAGMNVPWLKVRRRPRVALLATGDEVVMPGDPLGAHQIVSSNGLALRAFILACGGDPIDLGIAPDSADALRTMAEGAHGADMLVTTGGASVGEHDLVQQVLGDIGLEVDFWRIAMRPGKPLMFGRIGPTRMLGLPGNPVSALVCATIFLGPALGAMLGLAEDRNIEQRALLARALPQNDERQDYLRATLKADPDGTLRATPLEKQDSSVFSGLAMADCLVIRPPHAPAAGEGDAVRIIRLGGGGYSI